MKGNREKILTLLYKKKELTKQDIASEIGITIPTVISNIRELKKEGLAAESKIAESTGGRRPALVSFLPDSRFSFGVDISPESVRVILANLNSEIKYAEEFPIDSIKDMNAIMNKIVTVVNGIMKTSGISIDKILGIGFSLPGTVDEENFILELAPNLGFKNVNFKKYQDMFPFPMYIENEANAAAFGEINLGIAKEMRNLVYISITYGIGTGIVIQDNLYKGKNRRAGEFGHMTLIPGGKSCKCGRHGCWEMYSSERALLDSYKIETGKININIDDFFMALKAGDKSIEKIFDEYLDTLAVGIQNIIIILDPHYIVLGGKISAYSEYFMDKLKSKIFIPNSFFEEGDSKIFAAKLKENSSILGASLFPIQKIFLS